MTINEISLLTPLLAIVFGLLSFASPCCLPLLPAYLGMIAGSSGAAGSAGARRQSPLWNGLGFVAGPAQRLVMNDVSKLWFVDEEYVAANQKDWLDRWVR